MKECVVKYVFFLFFSRFPRLKNVYKKNGLSNSVSWRNECKTRILLGKRLENELDNLINNCYMKDELAYHDYEPFINIANNHRIGAWLIIDYLMAFIHSHK